MAISSEDKKKTIIDQIFWDSRVDASEIKVEVSDGIVNLGGVVSNNSAREAAEEDAWRVEGVSFVNNQISVEFPGKLVEPDDREIQTRIETLLGWNPMFNNSDINVNVRSGIVTLTGAVDTFWKKSRSQELIYNVSGVLGVINELNVIPGMEVSDKDIGEKITMEFERNSIDLRGVNIKVKNGSVELTGTVQDWVAYRAAYRITQRIRGVSDVVNNLIIGQ